MSTARSPLRRFRRDSEVDVERTFALSARPRRTEGILAQEAQGQTVLLRVDDGGYFALDEVGAAIWAACDGMSTIAEIVDRLCNDFDDAPRDVVTTDVLEFVAEMQGEQLLDDAA